MTYATAVFNRLSADSTLLTLLPGGVMHHRDLPEEGLSRDSAPSGVYAADPDGRLQPCCVVRGRAVVPTTFLRDLNTQFTSTQQVVECWFYDDPDAGWDSISLAATRVYQLLQEKPVSGSFNMTLANEIEDRAPELGDACFIRNDYAVIGRRST
jgi:hypothetical protein